MQDKIELNISKEQFDEIQSLLDTGTKLKAVKELKYMLGIGLKEAKETVDQFHLYKPKDLCQCSKPGHKKINPERRIVCGICEKELG